MHEDCLFLAAILHTAQANDGLSAEAVVYGVLQPLSILSGSETDQKLPDLQADQIT